MSQLERMQEYLTRLDAASEKLDKAIKQLDAILPDTHENPQRKRLERIWDTLKYIHPFRVQQEIQGFKVFYSIEKLQCGEWVQATSREFLHPEDALSYAQRLKGYE